MRAAVAALLVALAMVFPVPAGAVTSRETSQAQGYIQKHGADANRVQANVLLAELAILTFQKGATQTNLDKIAITAQEAHDNLNNVRNNFAETGSGAFGNAELNVFSGANELKNSMGALVAWSGNPNAATLAHFLSQFNQGKAEWNGGVKTIWRMAHRKHPPTV